MTITNYEILTEYDVNDLGRVVQQAIKDGWQPLGGVAVTEAEPGHGYPTLFVQAMVKTRTPDEGARAKRIGLYS